MTISSPLPFRRLTTRRGARLDFTELGFGTAPLGNLYRPLDEATAQGALDAAWDSGVRYYDTAPLYGLGLAETRLNRFLRDKPTGSYLLSTKVGRYLRVCPPEQKTRPNDFFETPARAEVIDYSYDGVMRSLEQSFERLGVDRVDILYCHDIDVWTHGSQDLVDRHIATFLEGGAKALYELRDSGQIAAIGAGINEWEIAERLARAGDFDLFLLAGRYTLLEQEALTSFLPLCTQKGIGIALGGPYNSGILATGAVPGAKYNYKPATPEVLDRVQRIERVCAAHGVRLAEAALRFPLGHPAVVSVIPGAQTAEEARRNRATLEAEIPDALWADLKAEGLLRADAPVPSPRAL